MSRAWFHGLTVVEPAVSETFQHANKCSIWIVEEVTIDVRGWVAVSFDIGQAEGGKEAVGLIVFRGKCNQVSNVTLRFRRSPQ